MSHSTRSLVERDAAVLWHPYSQHGLGVQPLAVTRGEGAYLELGSGERVLDGISSWWVNLLGHGYAPIARAVAEQIQTLDHVLFAGFTHEPAVKLAELLLAGTAASGLGTLQKVFYSDNGSTAVEVALKMAYQFHQNRGERKRQRFLALKNSYHGDTLGAMSASDPGGYHVVFRPLMPAVDFVGTESPAELAEALKTHAGEYAAFIFEPIVQGAGGMKSHRAAFLREAIALCRAQGVLVIADEVFTGFYRTGTRFAMEQVGVTPDFLCLSKGITGGVLPLAATLVTEEIFAAFRSREMRDAFLHGHSYTANPIACAAAVATLTALETPAMLAQLARIVAETQAHIARLRELPGVAAARAIGTIGAIELARVPDYFTGDFGPKLTRRAIAHGVLLRPMGAVLYTVPPYCVTREELAKIYGTMEALVDEN